MAHLYQELTPSTVYYDKKSGFTKEKWQEAIMVSRTLYVGNLSFYTTEEQIVELFSKCGDIKRVVMGLNRFKKCPCGFCFVEFVTHEQADQAVNLLNKTILDDRTIRVDWDAGIFDGRQFGRGETGGQWRDDFRQDFDEGRGGQGRNLLRKVAGNPDQQVYIGKRRHDHGRFGAGGGAGGGLDNGEPLAKRVKMDNALPMAFGSGGFGGYQSSAPWGSSGGKGKKGKGKGKW